MEILSTYVLPAIFGAIAVKLLDWVIASGRDFYNKGSLSIKNKRIELIKERYAQIEIYKKNPSSLAVHSIKLLSEGFLRFLFVFLIVVTAILLTLQGNDPKFFLANAPFVIGILGGYVATKFDELLMDMRDVSNFEKYTDRTTKKLSGLGVTLDQDRTVSEVPKLSTHGEPKKPAKVSKQIRKAKAGG